MREFGITSPFRFDARVFVFLTSVKGHVITRGLNPWRHILPWIWFCHLRHHKHSEIGIIKRIKSRAFTFRYLGTKRCPRFGMSAVFWFHFQWRWDKVTSLWICSRRNMWMETRICSMILKSVELLDTITFWVSSCFAFTAKRFLLWLLPFARHWVEIRPLIWSLESYSFHLPKIYFWINQASRIDPLPCAYARTRAIMSISHNNP